MKNILSVLTIATLFAACKSEIPDKSPAAQMVQDTSALYKNSKATDLKYEPSTYNANKNAVHTVNTKNTAVANNSNNTNSSSAAAKTTTKKKGWSHRAKGAAVGAGTGAITGAIINKNNRAAGAVIGTVIGAASGYIIGNEVDKKVEKKNP